MPSVCLNAETFMMTSHFKQKTNRKKPTISKLKTKGPAALSYYKGGDPSPSGNLQRGKNNTPPKRVNTGPLPLPQVCPMDTAFPTAMAAEIWGHSLCVSSQTVKRQHKSHASIEIIIMKILKHMKCNEHNALYNGYVP